MWGYSQMFQVPSISEFQALEEKKEKRIRVNSDINEDGRQK